ncbi:MAG: pYEATS domain-containing protein [Flavisolibacter sp.]
MTSTSNKYKIEQNSIYAGDDWWNWEIWIEGADSDLDSIDYVVYTLHSTFVKPVRQVSDRKSKFILKEEGWGTFTIYCKLFLKNNSTIQLQHDLILLYPGGEKLIEQRNKSFEVKENINETKKATPKKTLFFLALGLILTVLLFVLIRSFNKSSDRNASVDTNDYDRHDSTAVVNSSDTGNIDSATITHDDVKVNDSNDSLKFNNDNLALSRYRSKSSIRIDQRATSFNYNIVYINNGDTSVRNAKDLIIKLLQNESNLIKSMDEAEFKKKYSIQSNRN